MGQSLFCKQPFVGVTDRRSVSVLEVWNGGVQGECQSLPFLHRHLVLRRRSSHAIREAAVVFVCSRSCGRHGRFVLVPHLLEVLDAISVAPVVIDQRVVRRAKEDQVVIGIDPISRVLGVELSSIDAS